MLAWTEPSVNAHTSKRKRTEDGSGELLLSLFLLTYVILSPADSYVAMPYLATMNYWEFDYRLRTELDLVTFPEPAHDVVSFNCPEYIGLQKNTVEMMVQFCAEKGFLTKANSDELVGNYRQMLTRFHERAMYY